MNENIKVLLEKVAGDEGLLAKFSACKSVDEAYELAKELVGGFTKEEFVEAMNALNAADDGDISDEDLNAAAGGSNPVWESIKDVAQTIQKVTNSVNNFSEMIGQPVVNSVNAVTKSAVKSAEQVSKSVVKSAEEVSKSISKSVTKVSKALAV